MFQVRTDCVGSVCLDVMAVDTCTQCSWCAKANLVWTPAHQQPTVHCTEVHGSTKVVKGSGCVLELCYKQMTCMLAVTWTMTIVGDGWMYNFTVTHVCIPCHCCMLG